MSQSQYEIVHKYINRAVHVPSDSSSVSVNVHKEAFANVYDYLLAHIDELDYIVTDSVIDDKSRHKISDLLLLSTVWFDVTNGRAFVAHSDDGLSSPIFNDLGLVNNKMTFNVLFLIDCNLGNCK